MNPFIVTLEMDAAAFSTLDSLRKKYFPPARNFIPAHISLFHALPRDQEKFVESVLQKISEKTSRFEIRFTPPRRLGAGFAVGAQSAVLESLHQNLRNSFAPWLSRQDQQPFRPHVTLMNKAEKTDAEKYWRIFENEWRDFSGLGTGLLLWEYLGGPWRRVGNYPFV